ncbi:hypothetical protein LSH36_499g00014 [Paralvinella palmiformis]|uniref:Uncharacterized protein n=1 Tax=Paralvinella palmiformis TaxID=53620 RepID=A0AAD9MYJ1_9ANNE|nr:hypothetical protein LSH36_499g00014 [Paralvinella palmiformis]
MLTHKNGQTPNCHNIFSGRMCQREQRGGSLAKLAYIPRDHKRTNDKEAVLTLVSFDTENLDDCLAYIKKEVIGLNNHVCRHVRATGVSCLKYREKISEELSVQFRGRHIVSSRSFRRCAGWARPLTGANNHIPHLFFTWKIVSAIVRVRSSVVCRVAPYCLIARRIILTPPHATVAISPATYQTVPPFTSITSQYCPTNRSHEAFLYRQPAASQMTRLHVDSHEMDYAKRGIDLLWRHLPPDRLFHEGSDVRGYRFVCPLINAGILPCILVNLGSAMTIIKINKEGVCTGVVGGSTQGGLTFLGLGALLTSAKTYSELVDLAERGDRHNVDLLVRDTAGSHYNVSPDHMVSSFGKAAKLGFKNPRRQWGVFSSCDDDDDDADDDDDDNDDDNDIVDLEHSRRTSFWTNEDLVLPTPVSEQFLGEGEARGKAAEARPESLLFVISGTSHEVKSQYPATDDFTDPESRTVTRVGGIRTMRPAYRLVRRTNESQLSFEHVTFETGGAD